MCARPDEAIVDSIVQDGDEGLGAGIEHGAFGLAGVFGLGAVAGDGGDEAVAMSRIVADDGLGEFGAEIDESAEYIGRGAGQMLRVGIVLAL